MWVGALLVLGALFKGSPLPTPPPRSQPLPLPLVVDGGD